MYLARKITRAKWVVKDGLAANEIPADAVTADLRSADNALSFWRCGDAADDELRQAALAIVAKAQRCDKLDLVWVAEESLTEEAVRVRDTKGETPVTAMARNHVDASDLDLVRLGKVAYRIAESIRNNQFMRLTRMEVRDILTSAIKDRLIEMSALDEQLREEVSDAMGAD
jgi:hypothetical protein